MAEAVAQSARFPAVPPATLIELEGTVETARARTTDWKSGRTNDALAAFDRVRTAVQSRATLRLADRSLGRLGELALVTIETPPGAKTPSSFSLTQGLLFFFHRGKPADINIRTGAGTAGIRGTEFLIEVAGNGRTVLTLFDGEVELSNAQGVLRLVSGEQGTMDPGQAPLLTPMLVPKHDLIQWCLYYPGVLDADELNLPATEAAALQASLAAYRAGDLLQALALVPAGFQPASDSGRVYLAAVLLSVGKVDAATLLLDAIPPDAAENSDKPPAPRLATALRRLILVVKNSPELPGLKPSARDPKCATLQLAESYRYQARADLTSALAAAREATSISPAFGFAWARVAELEFSFGHRREAQIALKRSLELAPRNAQAVALRGFLLAAEDRIGPAFVAFNEAIALDGALGNAWLGRGLCRIRRGELDAGREDLQVAATLEPQRALFRSYLGKAWHELGDQRHAGDELRLAKANDPRDPTAYLYEALLLQEENRINEAIASLERSQELNDNRRVFRSRLLLDQDQAVRGANLATIYRDAGLGDVSLREASRASSLDYANWSAHWFLSQSYAALRDPRDVNLRYETAAVTEYLLANLLAPISAGPLNASVSQQEYGRLFARDRLGLTSATEYTSRGSWRQDMVQYGLIGHTAYALEAAYVTDPGEHKNGQVEQTSFSAQLRQQVGPADTIFIQAIRSETEGGDLAQYLNPEESRLNQKFRDVQEPLLLAGWHHEWGPGSHTLALVGWLNGEQTFSDDGLNIPVFRGRPPEVRVFDAVAMRQSYHSELSLFTGELQQLWQTRQHTIVAGARAQEGEVETESIQTPLGDRGGELWNGSAVGVLKIRTADTAPITRQTVYLYDYWQVWEPFQLVVGLTYDRLTSPRLFRHPPLALSGSDTTDEWLPKVGFVWQAATQATLRAAYTRALTGVSFDQSFRLEPSQVAGINQAFRSFAPETLAGANAGEVMDLVGLVWEQRWHTGTYLGLSAGYGWSGVDREAGAYNDTAQDNHPKPSSLPQRLEYQETQVGADLHQLLGAGFSLGVSYQWSRAQFDSTWQFSDDRVGTLTSGAADPDVFQTLPTRHRQKGDLHLLRLPLLWNHPSGFFAGLEGVWHGQRASDLGHLSDEAEEFRYANYFWQANVWAGWRGFRRRLEVRMGLLNLTDVEGGLHPVNLHLSPPRRRTFTAALRFNF